MKLCLSIAPASMDEAIMKLKSADESADIIELRIDGIPDLNLDKLLQRPRPKIIITNRRAEEGGKFTGSASEQLTILTTAMRLGAECIDIEMSWGSKAVKQILSSSRRSSIIVSYHNFRKTPADLISIYRNMRSMKPDIIKIATMARTIQDNIKLFEICEKSRTDRQPGIMLCMGEYGEISRILGGKFGSYLTYGSMHNSECTAPGQQAIADLKNIYRINILNKRTKVFGLAGNPVSQSHGIYLHNRFFARRSLNAVYVNFLVDNPETFFPSFREIISGISVTMPLKQTIIPLIDTVTEEASSINVVNTVINRKGKLFGYNTDLPAIVSLLKKRTSVRRKNVVVLGTGATAKTMAFAAITNGAQTTVVGRSLQKAQTLADQLGCASTTYEHLRDLTCDILMNGTPIGMTAVASGGRTVPTKFLRSGMIVFDAVYNPPVTPLLRDAEAAGCDTISGVELFERQAQLQSKLFLQCIS